MARAIALIALAATVIVGLLHTKIGRPLLARMGGCPAGFATREDMDNVKKYAATMSPPPQGAVQAPARPALGFVLDATTEDEFHAWAAKNNVKCEDNDRLGHSTCTNVPGPLLGEPEGAPIAALTIEFGPAHTIVNILAMRNGLRSADAVALFSARLAKLEKDLGAAPDKREPTGPAFFDGELFRSASATYKFTDYLCELQAVTMMDRTVTLREHFYSTR